MYANNFIPKTAERLDVEEILSDLIPGFLKNKHDDLMTLQALIERNDFNKIKRIGHDWKGACPSYGFNYLGEVGKQFEILAENQDQECLQDLAETLNKYLENLEINYCTEH